MNNYLITGITGQDGIFLTKKLLQESEDNNIFGISRNPRSKSFYSKLKSLCEFKNSQISIHNLDLLNKVSVKTFLSEIKPVEIYNFSGPSSVYDSYKNPKKTFHEITEIFSNLTNSMIELENFSKFFQASSSEMFGKNSTSNMDENTKFDPISPYAEAKLKNHLDVIRLKKTYGWNISSGIMFNHESQFRNKDYLIMKIINTAIKIKDNKEKKLVVGSLDYKRDWTYAEDTVDAIYKIVKETNDTTFVIGSGKTHSIQNMIEIIFNFFDLDWNKYLDVDSNLLRKNDPVEIGSNPKKLINATGWKQKYTFEEMVLNTIKFKYT